MIDIVGASFMTSAPNLSLSPPNELQNEVAFMARSNAGKSSLLNALTDHKNLAKVSSTPGKTRLINYFDAAIIDRERGVKLPIKLVDLPGFGYAKVSKSMLGDWEKNLTQFIAEREQLKLFVHLIDSRHTDLEIDRSVRTYLELHCREEQTIVQVFTKSDKLNQKELSALKRKYPDALIVSSSKKRGLDALKKQIFGFLQREVSGD